MKAFLGSRTWWQWGLAAAWTVIVALIATTDFHEGKVLTAYVDIVTWPLLFVFAAWLGYKSTKRSS